MDNKSIKNYRKIASSSYPPRSSSEKVNSYKACSCGLCRDFLCGGGYDLGTKKRAGKRAHPQGKG